MNISLNLFISFYFLSTLMPLMTHSGHFYLASVPGQKLSLETQNLF